MFHIASCASYNPPRRPTRGSGEGAVAEVLTMRSGAIAAPIVAGDVVTTGAGVVTTVAGGVHANRTRAAGPTRRGFMFMAVTGLALRIQGRKAFSACARSPSTGRR